MAADELLSDYARVDAVSPSERRRVRNMVLIESLKKTQSIIAIYLFVFGGILTTFGGLALLYGLFTSSFFYCSAGLSGFLYGALLLGGGACVNYLYQIREAVIEHLRARLLPPDEG